jgi:hypothetical protein
MDLAIALSLAEQESKRGKVLAQHESKKGKAVGTCFLTRIIFMFWLALAWLLYLSRDGNIREKSN